MADTGLLEDFLVGVWEDFFLDDRNANNLLAMLWTWQHGDVQARRGRNKAGQEEHRGGDPSRHRPADGN